MTTANIFYPGYIQIIKRKPDGWFHSPGNNIVNLSDREFDWINREKYFNLTKEQILTELFRRYQGKLGYYLVHLERREFYYCGENFKDVQQKLLDLGITQRDSVGESNG